jgi:CheY-like chemotaxis protein
VPHLVGWKEIAKYLRTSVRTAQRWEQFGLPVRRPPGTIKATVIADSGELTSWMGSWTARSAPASLPPECVWVKKPRVLAVDDMPAHRYAMCRRLQLLGFEVEEAEDGHEALRKAATAMPDVILLDVNLPDVLGLDVCRQLKADPRTRGIPVVFITATSRDVALARIAKDAGGDAYLFDPVEDSMLLSVLSGAMAKRARDGDTAEQGQGSGRPERRRPQHI